MNDLIYKSAVLNILNEGAELLRSTLEKVDIVGTERIKYEFGLGLIEACIADVEELQPAQPKVSCHGCKHLGKLENEVEYGYPSPCTRCKRRVEDNYEQSYKE